MKLRHFEQSNFGDALNPLIFETLLPGFFDDDPGIEFVGIGSLLGLDVIRNGARKIVFSTGFAYGEKPIIDDSFDVFCVRGPLTARALGLPPETAIADGALLLPLLGLERPQPRYDFSFMPHWESEFKFDWRPVCAAANVHYISPRADVRHTLDEIQASRVIIAEAAHAAIVADCLRVPWIAVKAYRGINEFKWLDWAHSLGLDYEPVRLASLFNNNQYVREMVRARFGTVLPTSAYAPLLSLYEIYQSRVRMPEAVSQLEYVKTRSPQLSDERLSADKTGRLYDQLQNVKRKYSH